MMRIYRLATRDDLGALAELASFERKRQVPLPDVVFVAEIDGKIEAAIGLSVQDGAVVAGPGIISRKFYGNPFVVFRLHDKMESWLRAHGVKAYVCSTVDANKRMQRWLERTGAHAYHHEKGRTWFAKLIGAPDTLAALTSEAA